MVHKFMGFTPEIHETCFLADGCQIIGDVIIGQHSSIWFNAVLRGDVDQIIIGQNTNIQDGALLHCCKGMELTVGNNVTVGHGAMLHSCKIEDGSLVGMGAIILDGVQIGKNCFIGAGALITPNTVIPECSLVLGSPAKVVRSLTKEEIEGLGKGAQSYFTLKENYNL